MEVRKEKVSDFYSVVVKWWENHKILYKGKTISYPVYPIGILPQNVFVVSDSEYDLYCVFFYHTDSGLGWIAYPTGNVEAPKKNKKGALIYLFNEVEKYAREQGYFLMFTTSPIKNVQEALLDSYFEIGDKQVNQYYKKLPPEKLT